MSLHDPISCKETPADELVIEWMSEELERFEDCVKDINHHITRFIHKDKIEAYVRIESELESFSPEETEGLRQELIKQLI